MVMNSPGIINPNGIEETDDDDLTTHTMVRLSSAATCLVAGVEYTHGQQIYREDRCEFCLCLDGEMFCWWQDCPPALDGPCKDRGPFSPCQNGGLPDKQKNKSSTVSPSTVTSSSTSKPATSDGEASSSTDSLDEYTTEIIELSSLENQSTSTNAPKICTVMGRNYNIGDRLPHDTGNCVECRCGAGAQITCSPHQCGPPSEDINDYRPPGLRSAQPDVF